VIDVRGAVRSRANILTLARAAAIPVILGLLALPSSSARTGAAALFALAAATDAVDGYWARKDRSDSPLGVFLDLTVDKLLVAAVLIHLVGQQTVAVWPAIVIVTRELLVSGVRAYSAAAGTLLAAARAGKVKMAVTSAAIVASIMGVPGAPWLIILAAALTVLSAWPYLVAGARLARGSEL
jgi:CDP-diacylglycerol--glycerol-3-phosphate 3-phosphatidyltransferase